MKKQKRLNNIIKNELKSLKLLIQNDFLDSKINEKTNLIVELFYLSNNRKLF